MACTLLQAVTQNINKIIKRYEDTKKVHREIIKCLAVTSLGLSDLMIVLPSDIFKLKRSFNKWNISLALDNLCNKEYIETSGKNDFKVYYLADKGRNYYNIMLKGDK